MKNTNTKIQNLFTVLSIMAILAFIIGGYLYYSALTKFSIERAHNKVTEQVQIKRNDIDSYLTWSLLSVKSLAGLKEIRQSVLGEDANVLDETNTILDRFRDDFMVSVCYLMDRSGNTVASSNRDHINTFVGKNYGFRPYFKQSMQGIPTVYMALGATSKKRGIYFSHPVYGEDKQTPLGVAVIKASVELIEKNLSIDNPGIVLLIDPHGVVFFSSRTDWLYQILWKPSPKLTSDIAKAKQFGRGPWNWTGVKLLNDDNAMDDQGNKYRVHKQELSKYPGWYLVSLHSHKEILKKISIPLRKSVGVGIVVLCVIFGLIIFLLFIKANTNIVQRKKAEKAFQESKEELKSIFRAAPTGIGLVRDRILQQVNDRICEMTGYSKNELIGQNARILYSTDEDYEYVGKEKYRQIKTLGTGTVETRFKCKDGEIIDVLMSSTPLDSTNLSVGVTFTAWDITERKMAEKALQASHKRFLTVLNSLDATIYVSDMATDEILFVNKSMIESFGRDVIGEICWDVFRGESGPCPHCTKDQLIDENNNPTDVCVWQDKNPITGKWYINYDRAIEWTDGRLAKLQIATDITERKKIEEDLRLSEERYREYFEENISGTYISNPDGHLIACNEEYRRIFGFNSLKHALDTPINNFFKNSNDRIDFLKILKKEKRVTGFEPELLRSDGTPIHLLENASGVFDEDGNLKHIRGFLLDVTEQKKLEAQLQQAHKMEAIGTLAGGIAHDFNNILFPVLGHTEMLLQDIPEDSSTHDSLKKIYKGAIRARDLVKQILTFSRQNKLELKAIRLQPIIKEAIKFIRSTIPATIEIKEDISFSCGSVKADSTQIHQIVMNLATNAYHAMNESGGKLKVSLKEIGSNEIDAITSDMRPGRYACLSVVDTGIGIKKKLADKIFDPFFTTKEKGKGTGMGLAVVHGIVAHMSGIIQVHSESGKGTHLNVYLPIERRLSEKKRKQFEESIQGGTETILIVDDEEEIIIMEEQILKRLGYQVVSHTSSREALETFCKTPDKFDMVITNMAMPSMAGDRLAAELFKTRPNIPILLCTGFNETMSHEKVASLGIRGFVMKPITINILAQKIRHVLDEALD